MVSRFAPAVDDKQNGFNSYLFLNPPTLGEEEQNFKSDENQKVDLLNSTLDERKNSLNDSNISKDESTNESYCNLNKSASSSCQDFQFPAYQVASDDAQDLSVEEQTNMIGDDLLKAIDSCSSHDGENEHCQPQFPASQQASSVEYNSIFSSSVNYIDTPQFVAEPQPVSYSNNYGQFPVQNMTNFN